VAILPYGSAFPGVMAAPSPAAKPALFFATAGEKGVLRVWRSDQGTCLYTHRGSSSSLLQQAGTGSKGSKRSSKKAAAGASAEDGPAAAGSEFVDLLLLPGGKGLLAATGDARLLFYHPQV
jgi:U3 small nucleolar RNA-associated protein 13